MRAGVQVIDWEGQRARTGPWRGDPHVAYLSAVSGCPPPSADFLVHCLDLLAAEGYSRVVTGALGPLEQSAFIEAGFEVHERLLVLRHDMRPLPRRTSGTGQWRLRRGRRADLAWAIEVDAAAFPAPWRLDRSALEEAITATPRVRFRVAAHRRGTHAAAPAGAPAGAAKLIGYIVTGLVGRRGYLQRLAVHPHAQRRGVASGLVTDALSWLRGAGAEQAMVNTKPANSAALGLYKDLGFVEQGSGLAVLEAELSP